MSLQPVGCGVRGECVEFDVYHCTTNSNLSYLQMVGKCLKLHRFKRKCYSNLL